MNEINLPIYPNKLLDEINDTNLINSTTIKVNKDNNFFMLERENNDLTFDIKYNPSQVASEYFKIHLKNTVLNLKNFFIKNSFSKIKCVDIGCGKGEFVELLNNDNYFDCFGFDTSYAGTNKKIQKRYLNKKDFDSEVNLIILKYVLDYIYPPNEFLNFLKEIFPKAYIYIEGPYIEDSIKNNRFYDISFEQINYFSKKTYANFFNGNILKHGDTFGNQYYYFISHVKFFNHNSSNDFKKERYKKINLDTLFPKMKIQLKNLKNISESSDKLWFWGAARKSVMVLHHLFECYKSTINKDKFGCVDQNPAKHGKYLPSTKIKVISANDLMDKISKKDKIIITNPSYQNEIQNFLFANLYFKPQIIIL